MTVDLHAPLRLARAVELAFPEGGMTVSGLRREIAKGRLGSELIAGKTFVTLAGIERMRELCRVQREPVAASDRWADVRPAVAINHELSLACARQTAKALREQFRSRPAQGKLATR